MAIGNQSIVTSTFKLRSNYDTRELLPEINKKTSASSQAFISKDEKRDTFKISNKYTTLNTER